MIKEYMAAGGNVVIVMDYQTRILPILLYKLLRHSDGEGIICEGDTDMFVPYILNI